MAISDESRYGIHVNSNPPVCSLPSVYSTHQGGGNQRESGRQASEATEREGVGAKRQGNRQALVAQEFCAAWLRTTKSATVYQ